MNRENRNMKDMLDAQLSALAWSEAESRAMMNRLKGGKPIMKKKLSLALALAMVLLAGAALAAGIGAFSAFAGEMNAARLEKLDGAAQAYGATVQADAPRASAAPAAQTLREEIEAYQDEFGFSLTLDQAYCDGQKLYYAYTLKTHRPRRRTFSEGRPTGFDSWDMEAPGRKVYEIWSYTEEERTAAYADWFGRHEEGYAVEDSVGIGDGCRLLDGRVCNIYDDGSGWIDENTLCGFQEVELPENAVQDGEVAFELSIHYGTAVTYQNADGAYSAYVSQRENRGIIRVPFAVQVNGQTRRLQGVRVYDGYTAKAELTVSDVEVFGDVTLTADDAHMRKAPDAFWPSALPMSYGLVADGQSEPLQNLDGALEAVDAHTLRVGVRFDLPKTLEGLTLRPETIDPADQPEDALDIRLTDKP